MSGYIVNASHTVQPWYVGAPSPSLRFPAHGVELTALHTAIRSSGLFAKFTAQRWGFRHVADSAQRVAVELIARAVETTGNPDPHPRYSELRELHTISIRVSVEGSSLLIEVWDSDPTRPQDSYHDNYLSTVEEISQRWNCYQPHNGGKVIWAELAIPQPCEGNEQLPQRAPRQPTGHETPVTPLRDKQLMQRVLNGLYRLDSRCPHE
jgi:hypothetical protein